MVTIPQCRCSILDEVKPRPVDCGLTFAMTDRRIVGHHRRCGTAILQIDKEFIRANTWRTIREFCRLMATLATARSTKPGAWWRPPAGPTRDGSSTTSM